MTRYTYAPFPYQTPPELSGGAGRRWPVAIVGAGPIGLAAAIDLALHGIACVVLDDDDKVSIGSRAICWSKRTLEIFDRLGAADRMLEKGVTWKVGRLFHGEREVWNFDLLPEQGHKAPAFINLQQYYVEEYLIARCRDFPELIELRFRNAVAGVEPGESGVRLQVETPDGGYGLEAEYLLACDGAKSFIRRALGLDFLGQAFEERFLIADVEVKTDLPSERHFWFDPPFHDGPSALLHKQPDDIYRIDLQLGPDADPEAEARPEAVIPRIEKVLGGRPFELDWVSVYRFQCRRLERFVHGRVIFVGDSAHVVSPFGARGGNGGIQDVDNLAWKLALVLSGEADARLLESYDEERVFAAEENILHAARTTRFMTPKTKTEARFRDETLALAADHAFARRLVNSGRLSQPCSLAGMALQSEEDPEMRGPMAPGEACIDAPLPDGGWLLNRLGGDFALLSLGPVAAPAGLRQVIVEPEGLAAERYGGLEGSAFLIRPDQHVAARFVWSSPARIEAALERAKGNAS